MYKVTFKFENSEDVSVFAAFGESLLEVARKTNVAIDAPCSGNASCGKCRVKLIDGELESKKTRHISDEEYADGWRLDVAADLGHSQEYNHYFWKEFRKAVKAAMGGASSGTDGYTKIMGNAVATAEQMKAYLKAKNPSVAQSVLDMVPLYLSEGKAEGMRGDIAFAQSCLETGNFTFSGSAVTLSQNNFCGMGVTSNGMKGNSFGTPQLGIRAQVQHLKAYASTDALKNACIDPRFKYVTRGCAEYVEWLGQKENPAGKGWATGAGYGEKILSILKWYTKTGHGGGRN